jgi:arylsulfatase A-like enzyme
MDMYDPDQLTLPEYPPEVEAQRGDTIYSDAELAKAHQAYYAMVTEVDHQAGRILDYLEEQGLAEDTIVVFTSDHGEWLGEHFHYGKGYPGHDAVSRTPLLVRWPQGIQIPGKSIHSFIEAVDLIPTLLDAAFIPTPPHLQGQSFFDVLCGDSLGTRRSALTEGEGWKTIRLPGWRYVAKEDGSEHLFDLEADPGAYQDVVDDPTYAEPLGRARQELIRRLLEKERPLPRSWAY